MSQTVLVDSDILIDFSRGIVATANYLATDSTSFVISAVTQMELIIGCRNKQALQALERFLLRFEIIPISEAISAQAVILLRQYNLIPN